MVSFLKSIGRVFYKFIALIFRAIMAIVSVFTGILFGRFSWQAPWWLKKVTAAFSCLGRWCKNHTKITAITAFTLVLAGGMGGYAYYWYTTRPQPYVIEYTVKAPRLTDYKRTPIVWNPLTVQFKKSVTTLEMIGKPVTAGITVTPAIEGSWHWASDKSLQFLPTADWPIDQEYKVTFAKEKLLAEDVLLDKYSFEFKSQPFKVTSVDSRLYEDPQMPEQKKVVTTLKATHPLDQKDFSEHVLLELSKGLGYLDKNKKPTPEIFFSENGLEVYIHSALLETPLEASQVTLVLSKGIKAQAGGNKTIEALTRTVTIAGLYQLSFRSQEIIFADNEQGEPEPVFLFQSSNPISDENIKNQVTAWLLPVKNPDKTEQRWSQQEVTEELLARSTPIPLTHVPSDEPQNSMHAFKFRIDPERQMFVKVNRNIKSLGGYLSGKETFSLLEMPEYPKTLAFLSEGALLNLDGERNLGIMARGVKDGEVEIARILPRQLHHLVNQLDGDFVRPYMAESNFDKLVERFQLDITLPSGDPAKTQYTHVNLSPYLNSDGGRHGIFVLRLSEQKEDWTLGEVYETRDVRFIVVTDLGIITKQTSDGKHDVFVQSISKGTPVEGATVEVYGVNGLPVASVQTDEGGRAHFADLSSLTREKRALMFVVSKGDDLSFLPMGSYERRLDFSRFKVDGIQENGKPDVLKAFMFSDRGLYRPGETAHLGLIVRAANWSGSLEGLPVMVNITDPRGQIVQNNELKLSRAAFESVDFTSGVHAPAGTYTAHLYLADSVKTSQDRYLGNVSFKVRDFEPDRMKVSVRLSEQAVKGWIKPEDVKATVDAMHLFGAPASDRRVTADMRLSPAFAAFNGYEDYRFYLTSTLEENFFEELAETSTNEEGKAELTLDLTRFEASAYNLEILARVFEAEGGRNVAAQDRVMVSKEDYLIGVKTPDPLDYVSKDALRKIDWVAIAPDLSKQAVSDLTYELLQVRYVSVLVQQNDGTYRYVSRRKDMVIDSGAFSIGQNGFEQTLKTSEPGSFIIKIKKGDQLLNQVDYTVAGNANTTRSLDRNAELELKLNKQTYAPGEEIEISVRAPYTGSGLITIERDKVYNHVWFRTDTTSSVQRIKVPEDLEGNAYINVQFVRDNNSEEIFMSPLSYGVTPFSISLDGRRTIADLQTPQHVEPGETVEIKVNLNRPSRIVVYGVDQGILQVARYKQPKPLEFFFQKRALEVSTSQILDLILPEFSNLMRSAAAGGDGEGALAANLNPFKRKNKPPVVWWSGIQSLPAGETTMKWNIPDYFNGELRFFAVAVDEAHIGIAQVSTEVRGPVVLTPNVPAFATPGDKLKVTSGIYSNLEQTSKVKVSLQTSDGLQVAGEALEFEIEPQHEAVATFELNVTETLGSADLYFVAELDNGKKIRISEAISVRPAVEHRVRLELGSFKDKTFELKPARNLYAQMRKVYTGVSGSPLVWGTGLQEYLDNYAYSCTEQLLSKAMPAIVWGSAASEADRTHFNAAVNMLRQRQNSSGGFGMWAATPQTSPYVTLYAADFLLEAKERGFTTPESMVSYINRYLSSTAKDSATTGIEELRNQAYAIYLLTRQGQVTSNQLSSLREHFEQYFENDVWQKDIAAVYMAATYKLLKQDQQANKLIAQQPWLLLEKKWASNGVYFDPLTHDAEYLNVLAMHFPERLNKIPEEVLVNFGKRLTERRYNSLSSALMVRALDNYGKRVEQNVTISVTAQLKHQQNYPLQMQNKPPRAAVSIETEKLRFEKTDSKTPAFYMLSESGYDKGTPDKPIAKGIEIIHDYLDLEGQPVSQVKVGEEFLVRIRLRSTDMESYEQVAVVDLLPGGVEPVYKQPALSNDENRSEDGEESEDGEDQEEEAEPQWIPPVGEPQFSDWDPDFIDLRDDRVVIYGTAMRDVKTFTYRVRAINEGTFVTPPAYAESMYDPTVQGQGMAGRLEIVAPEKE